MRVTLVGKDRGADTECPFCPAITDEVIVAEWSDYDPELTEIPPLVICWPCLDALVAAATRATRAARLKAKKITLGTKKHDPLDPTCRRKP